MLPSIQNLKDREAIVKQRGWKGVVHVEVRFGRRIAIWIGPGRVDLPDVERKAVRARRPGAGAVGRLGLPRSCQPRHCRPGQRRQSGYQTPPSDLSQSHGTSPHRETSGVSLQRRW